MDRRRELAAVFAGGAIGAVARAEVGEALPVGAGGWPWATFLVNVAGAFVLGWVVTTVQERTPPTPYLRPFLGTGFCGALTTFSTFQVELLKLPAGRAVAYAAASLLAGFLAVAVATNLVRARGVA